MTESWDSVAYSYDRVSRESRAHRDKIERVAGLVMESGAQRVLDFGCGSGVLERSLFSAGFRGSIVALDGSQEMVSLARDACEGRDAIVELRDLNCALPCADASFDGAVAMNVLFLLDDPVAAACEIRRVLSDGATFFVVMPKPDAGGVRNFLCAHFRGLGPGAALRESIRLAIGLPAVLRTARFESKLDSEHARTGSRYLSQEESREVLESAGFEIRRVSDIQAGQNWLLEAVAIPLERQRGHG